MSQQFETRQFINDISTAIEPFEAEIPKSDGWTQYAVHLRCIRGYLDKAEAACNDDDSEQAMEWIIGLRNEFEEFQATAKKGLTEPDETFAGTACWLWLDRQFAVPYRDGWFDGFAVLAELESTCLLYTSPSPRDRG